MPELGDIAYTKYAPSQQLSIDDLSKILYDPNKDIYMKNMEALGNIAATTGAAGNATEAYINALKFLPEDESIDRDALLQAANEMIYSPWDEKTSPAALSRFVSDFGKRISPSGDIGKATARYENEMKWELSQAKQLDSLPKDEQFLLRKEMTDALLNMDNVPQMENFAITNNVVGLPDFNTILSREAIAPIIHAGWGEGSAFRQQGYRYRLAQENINNAVAQNGEIQNWLEQYNRIHGTTDYDLNECIVGYDEKTGEVRIKENIPEILKNAIHVAWTKATEYSSQPKPANIGSGRRTTTTTTSTTPTKPPLAVTTLDMSWNGSFGDMDRIMEKDPRAIIANGVIINRGVKFSDLFTKEEVTEEHKDGTLVRTNTGKRFVDFNDIKLEYDTHLRKYKIMKNGDLVGFANLKKDWENTQNLINDYIENRNDVENKPIFVELRDKVLMKDADQRFFTNNFDILVENKNGVYELSNMKLDANTIVKDISGYSLASPFGDILFMATIKTGDEEQQVALACNNDAALNGICANIAGQKDLDDLGRFYFNNPEYIRFTNDWQRSAIKKDGDRYYKEIKFTQSMLDRNGMNNIPANFYEYSLRLYIPKKGNTEEVPVIRFYDRNGRPASGIMDMGGMNTFFTAMNNYMSVFENVAKLKEGDSMVGFLSDRVYGLDTSKTYEIYDEYGRDMGPISLDFDSAPNIQTYFMNRDESLRGRVKNGELAQIDKMLNDTAQDKDFNDPYYLALDDNGDVIPIKSTDAVHTGDIVRHGGNNYMIVSYGNDFALTDINGNFFRKYDRSALNNRSEFKVYKGADRGIRINDRIKQ